MTMTIPELKDVMLQAADRDEVDDLVASWADSKATCATLLAAASIIASGSIRSIGTESDRKTTRDVFVYMLDAAISAKSVLQ